MSSGKTRLLVGIPVFNEKDLLLQAVKDIVSTIKACCKETHYIEYLIMDDGSFDGSKEIAQNLSQYYQAKGITINLESHVIQQGYGTAITSILQYAYDNNYDYVATIDADLQHDASSVIEAVKEFQNDPEIDIISTSRYLSSQHFATLENVPYDRYLVNMSLSFLLNKLFATHDNVHMPKITDAFCGLKIYRVASLEPILAIDTFDYSYPLVVFITMFEHQFKLLEIPTALIYLEERRDRGGWEKRLSNYLCAIREHLKHPKQKKLFEQYRLQLWHFMEYKLLITNEKETIYEYETFWKKNKLEDFGVRSQDEKIIQEAC